MIAKFCASSFKAVYIHLPFCTKICSFCNFTVVPATSSYRQIYLDLLLQEIAIWKKYNLQLDDCLSVYFGGGTPSLFSAKELSMILQALAVPAKAKISVELNPEDCSLDYLQDLAAIGVNRLSLGLQSMQDKGLTMLQRQHSAQDNYQALDSLMKSNFINFNLDLIYGYPQQGLKDLQIDLQAMLDYEPCHFSPYHLTLEQGTAAAKKKSWQDWQKFNEELSWQQFNLLHDTLTSKKLQQYELSNFAVSGHESPQNIIYWEQSNFLGLGLGAFYRYANFRFSNCRNLKDYASKLRGGHLPILEQEQLTQQQIIEEYLLMNLRRNSGLQISRLQKLDPHIDWADFFNNCLQDYTDHDLAVVTNNKLQLTKKGLFVADSITTDICLHLERCYIAK